MSEYLKLEVGQAPPKVWQKHNFDGAIFEIDQSGFHVLTYLSGMTAKEKRAIKADIVRCGVIAGDNKVLTLIRFGASPLIFELSFDPTLYGDTRAYDTLESSNTIQITAIDSRSNRIESLRYLSIPSDLIEQWRKCWTAARGDVTYSQSYSAWLDDLYGRYSVLDLWNHSQKVGTLGTV